MQPRACLGSVDGACPRPQRLGHFGLERGSSPEPPINQWQKRAQGREPTVVVKSCLIWDRDGSGLVETTWACLFAISSTLIIFISRAPVVPFISLERHQPTIPVVNHLSPTSLNLLPTMAPGGFDIDMTEFDYKRQEDSSLAYPRPAYLGRRSATSSINSSEARSGKHGVMAKCQSSNNVDRVNQLIK